MLADKERERQLRSSGRKMTVKFVWWICFSEMKFIFVVLFLFCTLATVVQLLPNFRSAKLASCCLSSSSSFLPTATTASLVAADGFGDRCQNKSYPFDGKGNRYREESVVPLLPQATATNNGSPVTKTKRAFTAVGSAAYLFVQMGAYRGGPNSFAVVGLSSKPLHVFAKPQFTCEWLPHLLSQQPIKAPALKILPDWGFGRIYTAVVLNCTFNSSVGADGSGGRLVVHASAAGGDGGEVDVVEEIEALVEAPGNKEVPLLLSLPPKYDILYCGSPLYGDLSPQRLREWLAYHVKLFGESSHFVLYDAGGVHSDVVEVLRPWMEKGYVTLHDVRDQERFDGYYHNQFLVVNDCLHRYRFTTRWMFFFDADEFVYISPRSTLKSLLSNMSAFTQFTFQQRPMSSKICLNRDLGRTSRMWGLEKLVYRDVKRGTRRDRKYAIQPRNALATGVHMSQNIVGRSFHGMDGKISYFHYHGTVNERRDPCKEFVDGVNLTWDGVPYVLDTTLRLQARLVKKFELHMIGKRLNSTPQ